MPGVASGWRSGDTIVALATPPGTGWRAVVRASGPAARRMLLALDGAPADLGARAAFRAGLDLPSAFDAPAARVRVPCLAAWMPGQRSFTGEDVLEIAPASNPFLVERIVARLASTPGCRRALPGEFSARAYLNSRLTLAQAEGIAAMIAATTREELDEARRVASGEAGRRHGALAERLASLLARVEAGIDFADEEGVVGVAPDVLRRELDALEHDLRREAGREGEPIDAGVVRVALVGSPNAGKSTLFNALLGRPRAVVSDRPGSTRDALRERLDAGEGGGRWLPPVELIDLPGLETPAGAPAEPSAAAEAQALARRTLDACDVHVRCDPSGRFDAPGPPRPPRVLLVRTMADLRVGGPAIAGVIDVCALDGRNIGTLREAILAAAAGARPGGSHTLVRRHAEAIARAAQAIGEARVLLEPGPVDPAILASILRHALDELSELVGRLSPDDILGRIFARFCIGK